MGQSAEVRILLPIQEVDVESEGKAVSGRALWDTGATICLVTHRWARAVGLRGEQASVFLKVVNHAHEELRSIAYDIPFKNRQGAVRTIKALGVDTISKDAPYQPTRDVLQAFPEVTASDI